MPEEIEFTVKVKAIRWHDQVSPDSLARHIIDFLFHHPSYVYAADISDIKLGVLPEQEGTKYAVYQKLTKELAARKEIWDVVYTQGREDSHIRILEDCRRPSRWMQILLRPQGDSVHFTCMCLSGGVNETVPLEKMTETAIRIVKEHTCEPWPG
jgi:hypothetical protein